MRALIVAVCFFWLNIIPAVGLELESNLAADIATIAEFEKIVLGSSLPNKHAYTPTAPTNGPNGKEYESFSRSFGTEEGVVSSIRVSLSEDMVLLKTQMFFVKNKSGCENRASKFVRGAFDRLPVNRASNREYSFPRWIGITPKYYLVVSCKQFSNTWIMEYTEFPVELAKSQ